MLMISVQCVVEKLAAFALLLLLSGPKEPFRKGGVGTRERGLCFQQTYPYHLSCLTHIIWFSFSVFHSGTAGK